MSGYDKYVRGKVLGKGSFGQAVLVTNKLDGKNYVIKEIDISRMPKAEREASEQEAKLLMALSHPNIVRCLECFTHQSKLCIVMDWCSEGDLYSICQKRRGSPLPEDTILDWFVQMCLGLKHVHDRKILHRDIKTQNIFVSAGGLLKLGDFGVSKILNSTWQLAATAVGTPYYLSPEICQNRRYNQKSDIWSLGCVLYELTTGRHAFEAPNMRALIQKIVKGQYPAVSPGRSEALRDLIDKMLTLNWEKRPSINDILATPVMKARITKFLSATLQAHEFSHTIIHGRPQQGQLVVQAQPGAAAPKAALLPKPGLPAPGALPAAPAPALVRANSAASNNNNRRGPSPPPVNPVQAAAAAAAAAKAKAQQAAREREEAAASAAAAAAARREDEGRRQRELAAVAAHREVERMKLEEQRKKIEQERARLESERRKAEAVRQEAERKARLAEEAARKAAAEDARRRAEVEARRARMEEEARVKEAERRERERKRDEERARLAAQKKEYYAQKQEAARNRAAAEQQLHNGQIEVFDAPAPKPRRPWQSPSVPEDVAAQPPAPVQAAVVLTPEQRRAVWEEQRAAAERNRRAAQEAERGGGAGLANFLGVPDGPAEPLCAAARPDSEQGGVRHGRRQWQQPRTPEAVQQAYERRRQKLEHDAQAREVEIREYQQAHWRQMREAAARNRAAVLAEVGAGPETSPSTPAQEPPPQQTPDSGPNGGGGDAGDDVAEQSTMDFAAMIKEMQDVLVDQEQPHCPLDNESSSESMEEEEDVGAGADDHAAAKMGRFMLNGEEVRLPVRSDDSLAAKVEALRCHLEEALGTDVFLKVYRRLESLTLEDDDGEVSREFLAVLGPERLPYLQLIHQLIVCEETALL